MDKFKNFVSSIENFETKYRSEINEEYYFGFPIQPVFDIEAKLNELAADNIAYISMEYGLAPSIYNTFSLNREINKANQFYTHEVFSNYWLVDYLFNIHIDKMLDIPIYGGGLGVLAGDTIKSAADLGLRVAAVGILWNKGYFKQKFWYKHGQIPDELSWDPNSYPGLIPLNKRICIQTKEGPLYLRLWKYYVYSHDRKFACPLILLDSHIEENNSWFCQLTDQLYRSDDVRWKIYQRVILGIGAMKAIDKLGYGISLYHLNEGHAAFVLAQEYLNNKENGIIGLDKSRFAYTCHTPVAAGHDRFQISDLRKVLKDDYVESAILFGKESPDAEQVNLTYMCLNNCHKVNGVAQKHGEITRLQFPEFAQNIQSITNGVHLHTWLSKSFANLFDQYRSVLGNWRYEPENLKEVLKLGVNSSFRRDIFEAHMENKRNLLKVIKYWDLKEDVLTIGWARRIAGYKRPALIFHNIEKIISLAKAIGPIQIILAGKAHPNDDIGSAHIDEILDHIDQLNDYKDLVKVLILENYDTYFGKLLTSSVDVWLNNPLPPFEASGTSGMKAILNGVLQLSTLDGWVIEAENDNIGWIFGYQHKGNKIGDERILRLDEDSLELCDTLEKVIQLYYSTHTDKGVDYSSEWIDKMINCVSRGAFFNTQRMVKEYQTQMWGQFKDNKVNI